MAIFVLIFFSKFLLISVIFIIRLKILLFFINRVIKRADEILNKIDSHSKLSRTVNSLI